MKLKYNAEKDSYALKGLKYEDLQALGALLAMVHTAPENLYTACVEEILVTLEEHLDQGFYQEVFPVVVELADGSAEKFGMIGLLDPVVDNITRVEVGKIISQSVFSDAVDSAPEPGCDCPVCMAPDQSAEP